MSWIDEERAPGKVNLTLRVLGKRPDGYHELLSWFAFVSLADIVRVRPAERLSLAIGGPMAGQLGEAGDDNLVLRAARLLARQAGLAEPKIALNLEKHVPVAAGMGGGSADAAATLRLLGRVWSLDWPQERWMELAAELGSDVPVCLLSRAHVAAGRGERFVRFQPPPQAAVLLVNPMAPLSTAKVFARLQAPQLGPGRADAPPQVSLSDGNDLEAPAFSMMPQMKELVAVLQASAGCQLARITGSGPTVIALFDTSANRLAAFDSLRAQFAEAWMKEVEFRESVR